MKTGLKRLSSTLQTRGSQPNHPYVSSMAFLALMREWKEIVGEMLDKHTAPLRLQNKTLFVLTRHASFANQLSFMSEMVKSKIIQHLPELGNDIERLQFQASSEYFVTRDSQDLGIKKQEELIQIQHNKNYHHHSPYYKERKAKAETLFADMEDSEIKDALISLYLQMTESP